MSKQYYLEKYFEKLAARSRAAHEARLPQYDLLMEEGVMQWHLARGVATLICHDGEAPLIHYRCTENQVAVVEGTTDINSASDAFIAWLVKDA